MLRETLVVMRRNCPTEDAELLHAWRDGYVRWQDFYGTQLVEEIRAHVHARLMRAAYRKSITLARLAPWVLLREARRKLQNVYAGRAIPAADISAAKRRAET